MQSTHYDGVCIRIFTTYAQITPLLLVKKWGDWMHTDYVMLPTYLNYNQLSTM